MAIITLKTAMVINASDKVGVKVIEVQSEAESIIRAINMGKLVYPINTGDLRAIAVDNILGVYAGGPGLEPVTE